MSFILICAVIGIVWWLLSPSPQRAATPVAVTPKPEPEFPHSQPQPKRAGTRGQH